MEEWLVDDRREFLKRLVKGSVYSAPVIRTLATPPELAAVVQSSMKMGDPPPMLVAPTSGATGGASTAPWARPPGG